MDVFLNILTIIFVVLFFGFSVFIHEFGHMIAAIWRGAHVDKFSIGFGHRIWGFTYKKIEFIIGWIPLGGYVALPQLEPTEELQSADGTKLKALKPLDKIIIAIAGPLFNLIFAAILACFVWYIGVPMPAPANSRKVLEVPVNSAEYRAGLRKGDVVKQVNGEKFHNWKSLLDKLMLSKEVQLTIHRNDKDIILPKYFPEPDSNFDDIRYPKMTFENPAVIAPYKDGLAHKAGIKPMDLIIAMDGIKISSYQQVEKLLLKTKEEPVTFTILREEKKLTFTITPKKSERLMIGIVMSDQEGKIRVLKTVKGLPAESAGLQSQDIITSIDGEKINSSKRLMAIIKASKDKPLKLEILRDDKTLTKIMIAQKHIMYSAGFGSFMPFIKQYPTPIEQFSRVITQTFSTLKALFSGAVSVKHMSSVFGISHAIYVQVDYFGFIKGLSFIVLINISLAIFNLFPIPVLDGGHILFSLIESITRKPVPLKVIQSLTAGFAMLLISFMIFVSYHDIRRMVVPMGSNTKNKAKKEEIKKIPQEKQKESIKKPSKLSPQPQ